MRYVEVAVQQWLRHAGFGSKQIADLTYRISSTATVHVVGFIAIPRRGTILWLSLLVQRQN